MLRNRYDPLNLLELVPSLGRELESELAQLDRLLDDDRLIQTLRADLVRRYPCTATRGRHSTPVEVILRMLVVKRLYRWSYAEAERGPEGAPGDSLVLRQFCRLYLERAPELAVDRCMGLSSAGSIPYRGQALGPTGCRRRRAPPDPPPAPGGPR